MSKFIKKTFDFSMKNVLIPTKEQYFKSLIFRVEDFFERMRWASFFFLKNEEEKKKKGFENSDNSDEEELQDIKGKETYGFRTSKAAPPIKQIEDFEKDVLNMIEETKFDDKRTNF